MRVRSSGPLAIVVGTNRIVVRAKAEAVLSRFGTTPC